MRASSLRAGDVDAIVAAPACHGYRAALADRLGVPTDPILLTPGTAPSRTDEESVLACAEPDRVQPPSDSPESVTRRIKTAM